MQRGKRCIDGDAELSVALSRNGIYLETDIEEFWDLCASRMTTSEDRAACQAIGPRLKSKYFALFVQSMLTVSLDEIMPVIMECGGKASWLHQIEALLGRNFKRVHVNAPLSAYAVDDAGTPSREKEQDASSTGVCW